jgi:tetratricopeptide (TPR) repeat protein
MSSAPAAVPLSVVSRSRSVRGFQHFPLLLLLAIVVFGIALRVHFFNPGLARTPDERTYTRQANVLLAQGTAGFRFLDREFADNPAVFSFQPSPTHAGYLVVLALFMRLTGDTSVLAGAHLSLVFDLASLLLLAFAAYRLRSPTVAIVATLFYAVLPFDLTVFRRTWQESLIALLSVAFLALGTGIARSHSGRRMAYLFAFTVLGVLALSTKPNCGIAYLLCAIGLTLHLLLTRDRGAAAVVACCAAIAVLVDVTVLAALFGSLSRYLTLERAFLHLSAINPYDMQFAAGPAWMYPAALFCVCPVVVLGALTGFAVTLRRALRARALADAGLPVGIALLCLLMMLLPLVAGRYNFRYAAPAYGPLCLLAGLGVEAILSMLHTVLAPLGRSVAWAIVGFAIAVAALHDLDTARDSFLVPELQDLALRPIYGVPPLPLSSGLPLDVSAQSGGQTGPSPTIEQEEEIVREHPTEDNRVNLSLAYIRAQEPGRAISLLSTLIAEDRSNVRAWNNLCVADTMQMHYNLAIAACHRALLLAPDFELAQNNLKWAEDEDRKAIAAVRAQEQIAPAFRDAASYLAEGLNDLDVGNYDQAIEAWRHVLRLDPANALAANDIGTAYMLRQQPELAIPWFQRAIAGDPNLQIASNNLAWARDELAKAGR